MILSMQTQVVLTVLLSIHLITLMAQVHNFSDSKIKWSTKIVQKIDMSISTTPIDSGDSNQLNNFHVALDLHNTSETDLDKISNTNDTVASNNITTNNVERTNKITNSIQSEKPANGTKVDMNSPADCEDPWNVTVMGIYLASSVVFGITGLSGITLAAYNRGGGNRRRVYQGDDVKENDDTTPT